MGCGLSTNHGHASPEGSDQHQAGILPALISKGSAPAASDALQMWDNETKANPVVDSSDSSLDDIDFDQHGRGRALGELALPENTTAILQKTTYFQQLPLAQLEKVIAQAAACRFLASATLFTQGKAASPHEPVYVVLEGAVQIVISGEIEQVLAGDQGTLLGELSALFGSRRNATVQVTSACAVLLAVPRKVFRSLRPCKTLVFLRKVPILRGLSDVQLTRVGSKMTPMIFPPGSMLITFGEASKSVFIIRSGVVRVVRPVPGRLQGEQVALLQRGQIVGQKALTTGGKRTANCLALDRVEALVFGYELLDEITNPALLQLLDYDLVLAVLQHEGILTVKPGETPIVPDTLFDCVDFQHYQESHVLVHRGEVLRKLYIIRSGGIEDASCAALKVANGISYLGTVNGYLASDTIVIRGGTSILVFDPDAHHASPGFSSDKKSLALRPLAKVDNIDFSKLKRVRLLGCGSSGKVFLVSYEDGPIGTRHFALKCVLKNRIRNAKELQHTQNELHVLRSVHHPFCTQFIQAYQDQGTLFILQEWVSGGELFNQLKHKTVFSELEAVFYAANVSCALDYLHRLGIVYRDLKPENLLLDAEGYIKLADFGLAKNIGVNGRAFTVCGTPEYQAPEVLMRKKGTGKEADYWALGILIYEMLVGQTPFAATSNDMYDVYKQVIAGRFVFPRGQVSRTAQDLIKSLLRLEPEKRLGAGQDGPTRLRAHPWFKNVDWEALEQRKPKAPIQPDGNVDPIEDGPDDDGMNRAHSRRLVSAGILGKESWAECPWVFSTAFQS